MLEKINKLIDISKNKNSKVYDGLVSLAEKVKEQVLTGREYLLIDIKEMESLVSPDKVETKDSIGKMELDL